jgi:hypothetical protein
MLLDTMLATVAEDAPKMHRRCTEDGCTKFKMPDENVDLELQWESRLEKNFNVFTVGKIFR